MMPWYVSPHRRIARRQRHIARNAGIEENLDRENVLPVEVKSADDAFMISALIPGIEADDIDVEILSPPSNRLLKSKREGIFYLPFFDSKGY